MRKTVLLIFGFFPLLLIAQIPSLSGRVYYHESGNKRPVGGLNITLKRTKQQVATDSLGRFYIPSTIIISDTLILADNTHKTVTVGTDSIFMEIPVKLRVGNEFDITIAWGNHLPDIIINDPVKPKNFIWAYSIERLPGNHKRVYRYRIYVSTEGQVKIHPIRITNCHVHITADNHIYKLARRGKGNFKGLIKIKADKKVHRITIEGRHGETIRVMYDDLNKGTFPGEGD